MSEENNPTPTASLIPLAWKGLAWVGGIIFLAGFSVVLLYVYGDPRPTFVDPSKVAGGLVTIPEVTPGATYYRISADYAPLTITETPGDPIAGLWTSLFSEAVTRAGQTSLRLRLSHPARLGLPRDKDGYLLLDTSTIKTPTSATTPFLLRQSDEKVELRLDVSPKVVSPSGILPKMLWAAGSDRPVHSGWISVFSDGSDRAVQMLNPRNAILAVRDFSGRAIGIVRIGIETRSSMLFPRILATDELERLTQAKNSFEARRTMVLGLIGDIPDLTAELRDMAIATLMRVTAVTDRGDGSSYCRHLYRELSQNIGLSNGDAAGLTLLLLYQPKMVSDRRTGVCGDPDITATLEAFGLFDALDRLRPAQTERAKKLVVDVADPKRGERPSIEKRYVCLGLSGPRIARHCKALNDIAGEWRGGEKFLKMVASRQYIAPHVGLEEPTPEMKYYARRFSDRRQLLIHVALASVENFACFRLTRENPDYFEALVVMRDNESGGKRRLDVFEFAFESDGRIGRIRRRAAMQSDIDVAVRLPETSRCRREFLSGRGVQMRRLVRDYWRVPAVGG